MELKRNDHYDSSSSMEFYSYGVVVEDCVFDGKYHDVTLKVVPIEKSYLFNDRVDNNFDSSSYKGKNQLGFEDSSYETRATRTNYIIATWLPEFNTNRASPPDTYKGQTVKLYKLKNVNVFFWTDAFFEPSLKLKEHVDFVVSNKSNIEPTNKNLLINDYYRVWISSRLKTLGFTLPKDKYRYYGDHDTVISFNANTNFGYAKLSTKLNTNRATTFQLDFKQGTGYLSGINHASLASRKMFTLVIDRSLDESSVITAQTSRDERLEADSLAVMPITKMQTNVFVEGIEDHLHHNAPTVQVTTGTNGGGTNTIVNSNWRRTQFTQNALIHSWTVSANHTGAESVTDYKMDKSKIEGTSSNFKFTAVKRILGKIPQSKKEANSTTGSGEVKEPDFITFISATNKKLIESTSKYLFIASKKVNKEDYKIGEAPISFILADSKKMFLKTSGTMILKAKKIKFIVDEFEGIASPDSGTCVSG